MRSKRQVKTVCKSQEMIWIETRKSTADVDKISQGDTEQCGNEKGERGEGNLGVKG